MAGRNRGNRLASVIQIAEDEEKKALSNLAKCREEIQGQQQKLSDLESYREEYREQMRQSGMATPQQVQNRFAFMQKLEFAINGQKEQITNWEDEEERLRRVWLEKRVRRRALNKASEQRQARLLQEEKRREQKKVDDLASRKGGS